MRGRWGNVFDRVVHRIRSVLPWRRRVETRTSLTARVWHDELDGGYGVEVVELPGVVSQGETEQEAMSNVVDAINEVFEAVLHERMKSSPHAATSNHAPATEHRHRVRIAVSASA
jgi:predicted RNase H-like HicB family nuclease